MGTTRPYRLTGPVGVQRLYAVLTRFRPEVALHPALRDAELRVGLDALAKEIGRHPQDTWQVIATAFEVIPKRA